MIWRVIVVSWALALLAGLVVYFSGDLFSVFNLHAEQSVQLLNWSELMATVLAIVGTLGLCAQLLFMYVLSPRD